MTVVLDLDDGTYGVDLSGTVTACSRVSMQVAGQDVSYDADDAAFTVMPDVQASLPQIPRDGLYLNLSSPALVAAGQGLPLVGVGRLLVQLGRVPDNWYKAGKRNTDGASPTKKEPPKKEGDSRIVRVKALSAVMHAEPDYLSDGVKVVGRNQEVRVIEQKGYWQKVEDKKH